MTSCIHPHYVFHRNEFTSVGGYTIAAYQLGPMVNTESSPQLTITRALNSLLVSSFSPNGRTTTYKESPCKFHELSSRTLSRCRRRDKFQCCNTCEYHIYLVSHTLDLILRILPCGAPNYES